MRRDEFEHVIAAAAEVSGEREIVVIGSQAILGSYADPPKTMLFSMEVDVYPSSDPRKAEEIDGRGWEGRLVRVEIPPRVGQKAGAIALCLEVHDLVLAKCVAGRERDWEFAHEAIAAGIVEIEELLRRVDDLPEPPADRGHVRKMLGGLAAGFR